MSDIKNTSTLPASLLASVGAGSGLYSKAVTASTPAPAPEPFSHTSCIPEGRPKTRPVNKYDGTCADCGGRVEAGAGYRFRDNGAWKVAHPDGECPKVDPKAPAPSAGVRGGRFETAEIHPGIYTVPSDTASVGHRTFRVFLQPPDEEFAPGETLLQVLVGSDNDHDYRSIAFIKRGRANFFRRYREAEFKSNREVIADAIKLMEDPEAALVSKNCLRCNATLTRPDSIERGLGPECAKVGW